MNGKLLFSLILFLMSVTDLWAQVTITGSVKDNESVPLPGVNIIIKGTTIGTITDANGMYSIKVDGTESVLIFSFLGFLTEEVLVGNQAVINVTMIPDIAQIQDVVVIGYGVKTKESVVGSIVQAKGEDLMKSGGVSTVGQALIGKLPGVTSISSTGKPGDEQPVLFIRGKSTWNGGEPLVLVDGIERSMADINVSDVESISVLKDASATAVFGVKGANGVILITTKRGREGKTQLSISANTTFKYTGKLPEKLDSYEGFMVMNEAIERTISYDPRGWPDYMPMEIAERYRNPRNEVDKYVYPNIEWKDWTMKDFANDNKVNFSIRGGTEFAKYFGSLSYQYVGDIFNGSKVENGRSYQPDYRYDRFNYRSNIDFDITSTTRVSVNLAGFYGVQQTNDQWDRMDKSIYGSIYMLAPSIYYPQYEDGIFGIYPQNPYDLRNPMVALGAHGSYHKHRVEVNSDFVLEQKLDFVLKGLKLKGSVSYDNKYKGIGGKDEPNYSELGNDVHRLYNQDGTEIIISPPGSNQFDFVRTPWTYMPMNLDNGATSRRLFYQVALSYDRVFADAHNVSVLSLMNREKYAQGSKMATFREDWVARITYDYKAKYFLDINGAYNGSEIFGPENRFQLFPSFAMGWMITNENFMEFAEPWLSRFKIRGSYGLVGDDLPDRNDQLRWAYVSQWGSGGYAWLDDNRPWNGFSPYIMYREAAVGNPDLKWETAAKTNFGADLGFFNNALSITMDYFIEKRKDIIILSNDRNVPTFLGINPPPANLGKTEVNGFEIEANYKYAINQNWSLNLSGSYTIARDKIIYAEDPLFRDDYLKKEGYAIDQPRVQLPNEIMASWDDIYMAPRHETNQDASRPGYYSVIDFNGDGVIDSDDNVPYSFPLRPKNSWNTTFEANYKSWSFMIMFFGGYNAFKNFNTNLFSSSTPLYFEHVRDYWTVDNTDTDITLMSWQGNGHVDPLRNWYDASYIKLQNIELSYTYKPVAKNTSFRFYINGNDLYTWSHLPDQRQEDGDEAGANQRGNYPLFRRVNIGIDINF